MWLRIYVFLYWWILFLSQINYLISKSMIGENIRTVSEGEFLAVVSIMAYTDPDVIDEEDHYCNGVLVTQAHVLSAAHCLKFSKSNEVQIIVGSRNLRQGRRYFLLWWISYNKWIKYYNLEREFDENDIAVGKLTENVDYYIDIPLLSSSAPDDLYGSTVKVVAWGPKMNGEMSKYLKEADLTVLTIEECIDRMEIVQGERYSFPERYLCTVAEPYALMKRGDSGAPVYYMDKIVGVHKATCPFPNATFHPFLVNVHIGIDYYRNFILHVTDSSFHWH